MYTLPDPVKHQVFTDLRFFLLLFTFVSFHTLPHISSLPDRRTHSHCNHKKCMHHFLFCGLMQEFCFTDVTVPFTSRNEYAFNSIFFSPLHMYTLNLIPIAILSFLNILFKNLKFHILICQK
jgi:hypothetical protein